MFHRLAEFFCGKKSKPPKAKAARRKQKARTALADRKLSAPIDKVRVQGSSATTSRLFFSLTTASSLMAVAADKVFSTIDGSHSYIASSANDYTLVRMLTNSLCGITLYTDKTGEKNFLFSVCNGTAEHIEVFGIDGASNSSANILCVMDYLNRVCLDMRKVEADGVGVIPLVAIILFFGFWILYLEWENRENLRHTAFPVVPLVPLAAARALVEQKEAKTAVREPTYEGKLTVIKEKCDSIIKKYPLDKEVAQLLVEINRFEAVFKSKITRAPIEIAATLSSGETDDRNSLHDWFRGEINSTKPVLTSPGSNIELTETQATVLNKNTMIHDLVDDLFESWNKRINLLLTRYAFFVPKLESKEPIVAAVPIAFTVRSPAMKIG